MAEIENSKDLISVLWSGADILRSKMDANEYKDYLLGIVFYKYLSDSFLIKVYDLLYDEKPSTLKEALEAYKEALKDESAEELKDQLSEECHYVMEPELTYTYFADAARNNSFNREQLQKGFNNIEQSDPIFADLFTDIDLYSNRLGAGDQKQSDTVASLIKEIDKADLLNSDAEILGNAYEYLIGQFASETGKKAGEFYTPQAVSKILTKIAISGQEDRKGLSVYDPCMGSGSLLLNAKKYAFAPEYIKYYGQEQNTSTYNLARMNMFLHGIVAENQHLRNGDTLDGDWPTGEETDFNMVLMNPPYSAKWSAAAGFLQDDSQLKDYNLINGDVLFVRSSVKLEGVGEAALVPQTLENTTYSGFIIRFRDEYGLDNNFKRFVFGIDSVRNQIMSQATNSANKNISQSVLENLELAIPSKSEQQKIGAYFSNLDYLITLHHRKQIYVLNTRIYEKTTLIITKEKKKMPELEKVIEDKLIEQLVFGESQWTYREDLKTEEDLWKNFRYILEQNNKARLDGQPLSDAEFEQVKNQLQFSSFYKAGEWLVGENGKAMVHVQRDTEKLHLVVMNHEHIAGGSSVYEVINQYNALKDDDITTVARDRRFDVTLMINGLPMIHIELKNRQHSYMDAFYQIKKYISEGKFTGIFSAVQMFVISNGVDTKYFAAASDTELNPKFMSGWVDTENNPVADYIDFAKNVLRIPEAHEMIARYTVLDEDAKRLILGY